ncbi:MAG: hypothetical protein EOO01_00015 [Chitinophagaceae bacterium]|nr:MAG: hypothetical protein EOO01_00015 [Chitinophagaceae bacterium]
MRQHDLSLWTIPSSGKKPTSLQIEEFMITVIKSRAVKPRECIPSHRTLAKINNVNRNTSLRAYTKLIAAGWLAHNHGGRATVADPLPAQAGAITKKAIPDKMPIPIVDSCTNNESRSMEFVEIGLSLLETLAPRKQRMKNDGLNNEKPKLLNSRPKPLKEYVFSQLLTRGFRIQMQNTCLIRGRAESLSGIFKALSAEGCTFINTAPADNSVTNLLDQCRISTLPLEINPENFLRQLQAILQKTAIRAIYIRPCSSYPTCQELDEASAIRLIELAKEYGFYIIEEDDDHELWWGRSPVKPLSQYDHNGHVIYCAALSRTSPYMQHLKTVIAPAQFISKLEEMAEIHAGFRDPEVEKSIIEMITVNNLIAVSRSVRLLKQKHLQILDEILRLQLGKYITYELPQSGTALWISFAKNIDLVPIIETMKTEGFPLRSSHYRNKLTNAISHMRLDFSRFSESQCRKAAIRLRALLSIGSK